jgi:hypothetical protein
MRMEDVCKAKNLASTILSRLWLFVALSFWILGLFYSLAVNALWSAGEKIADKYYWWTIPLCRALYDPHAVLTSVVMVAAFIAIGAAAIALLLSHGEICN